MVERITSKYLFNDEVPGSIPGSGILFLFFSSLNIVRNFTLNGQEDQNWLTGKRLRPCRQLGNPSPDNSSCIYLVSQSFLRFTFDPPLDTGKTLHRNIEGNGDT